MATGIVPQVPQPATDFVPEVFGSWTATGPVIVTVKGGYKCYHMPCVCLCGKLSTIPRKSLVRGSSKSCGKLSCNKNRTGVTGKGCNDSETPILNCPFYARWHQMMYRTSDKYKKDRPTYEGCTTCDHWLVFSNFKRWMMQQDWEGKHLDKDLLGTGKEYSPDYCVFVSAEVNSFLTERTRRRGLYPIGVHYKKASRKYAAQISLGGKKKHLGYFESAAEAHEAWLVAKIDRCKEIIKEQTCARTIAGLTKYMLNLK